VADALHISAGDVAEDDADRFARFRLISWWDQRRLRDARVLVVGAGALGNEIIKNLALLGIGHLLVADLDQIENSNLSRSVLYREKDNGQFKATAAARAARELYPEMRSHAFVGNAVYDLGLGVYRWADVVLGGLDNREARLSINRACFRLNKPWIDGAIEQINGTARVFAPPGACYECTMSETDWKLLSQRRSCNLLSRSAMLGGKTPTTPTISSLIAAVQCQEALKLLHGMDSSLSGRGFVFNGLSTDAYPVEFQRKEECYSHEAYEKVIELDASVRTMTGAELLAIARRELGPAAEIELARDVLDKLVCPNCKREEMMFTSLGRVSADKGACPWCDCSQREVVTFYKLRGTEAFLDRPLAELGIPPFDILAARCGGRYIGLELSGDGPEVLGPLAEAVLEL
jgi:adenylyltransferase/sulfurtransferase